MSKPSQAVRMFIRWGSLNRLEPFVKEGLLFMNTLEYFRGIESDDPAQRGDVDEGLTARYDPSRVVLEMSGQAVDGLNAPIDLRMNNQKHTNIFCLTAITDQDIIDAGGKFRLSEKFREFGDAAAVISGVNITAFKKRLKEHCEKNREIIIPNGSSVIARHIEYLDPATHHGEVGVFRKFNEYSWQQEWRVAINQSKAPSKPYDGVRLGDLSDIAKIHTVEEIMNWELKFAPNGL